MKKIKRDMVSKACGERSRTIVPCVGLFFLVLTACGMDIFSSTAPALRQPSVLSVDPVDGQTVEQIKGVTLTLSLPVEPKTVNAQSFLVVPANTLPVSTTGDPTMNAIKNGLQSLSGSYLFFPQNDKITWAPDVPLEKNQEYMVIVTSKIESPDHYPLSQTPGMGSTFFVSRFHVDDQKTIFENQSVAPKTPPEFLVINEILYNPLVSDFDGNSFIELCGTPSGSLAGYQIRFVNGDDGKKYDEIVLGDQGALAEDGLFVIADAKTGNASASNVARADWIDNFDPQNGPDSVQLLDPKGMLVDAVGYGDDMMTKDENGNSLFLGNPAINVAEGYSISRVDCKNIKDNSKDFVENQKPSPGSQEITSGSLPRQNQNTSSESGAEPKDSATKKDVHFTEVVTDPQLDWNDSSGGDGIAFNPKPGSGTIGSTDEWIEIKNGRATAVDLGKWKLEMLDGTDETEVFGTTGATLVFSKQGTVKNFGPDEFLVIGNPAGDLKNTITLRLLDETDQIIDEVSVADGNANGIDDESFGLGENGEWKNQKATIGF